MMAYKPIVMKLLVLGSKEFPLGTSDDPLPSGGIEVYIENFLKALQERGIEILVITRKFPGVPKREVTGSIEILRVPWIKGFYFRNISFNFAAFLSALRKDYDIIHANGPIGSFFGMLLSKVKGVPLIAVPHGLTLEQPQYNRVIRKTFAMLEKFVYSRVDHVVFLSEQEKDQFIKKLGFLPTSWSIISPGIDFLKIESEKSDSAKKDFGIKKEVVITFTGRLIGVKGVEYLVKAARYLEGDFKILIVGDGPERQKLERLVSDSGLTKRIIFTGHRKDVPNILAISDIFVLPSISEGLPTSLLEAMATGLPCVVTDIGLPVVNGETALVVPSCNEKELANAINKLLKDVELRKILGKKAKREIMTKYSWDKAVESYKKIFHCLLER